MFCTLRGSLQPGIPPRSSTAAEQLITVKVKKMVGDDRELHGIRSLPFNYRLSPVGQ
jgi:hypothetical protein